MLPDEIQDKLTDVGCMIIKTGKLDNKTKALTALSAAAACYCVHCCGQARSIAEKFGATDEEIEEVRIIALRTREKCQMKPGYSAWINKLLAACARKKGGNRGSKQLFNH